MQVQAAPSLYCSLLLVFVYFFKFRIHDLFIRLRLLRLPAVAGWSCAGRRGGSPPDRSQVELYDEDGDVVLTVELPTESIDPSEIRTALSDLLRHAVSHRKTLREAAS